MERNKYNKMRNDAKGRAGNKMFELTLNYNDRRPTNPTPSYTKTYKKPVNYIQHPLTRPQKRENMAEQHLPFPFSPTHFTAYPVQHVLLPGLYDSPPFCPYKPRVQTARFLKYLLSRSLTHQYHSNTTTTAINLDMTNLT